MRLARTILTRRKCLAIGESQRHEIQALAGVAGSTQQRLRKGTRLVTI